MRTLSAQPAGLAQPKYQRPSADDFSPVFQVCMSQGESRKLTLGFLDVRPTPAGGVRGGYLITSDYGRPIEFHYTSELLMTGPHRLLYGAKPPEYLYVEVLLFPLTLRQTEAPQIVIVGSEILLSIRERIPAPVVWLRVAESGDTRSPLAQPHVGFEADAEAWDAIAKLVPKNFDWLEPIARLAGALDEIRDPPSVAA